MLLYMFEQGFHIIRKRCGKCKKPAGYRMCKGKPEGVKSLTANDEVVWVVKKIARQRVTDIFHMNTNLMGTSCFQL